MNPNLILQSNAPSTNTSKRLQKVLGYYRKIYPTAWRDAKNYHALKGSPQLGSWPDSVYVPMAGSAATVEAAGQQAGLTQDPAWLVTASRDYAVVAALSAWRPGQMICRFAPNLLGQLWQAPVTGVLTAGAFASLPEYGVYIEAPPGAMYEEEPLLGAFAHLEWDVNHGHMELRLLLDLGDAAGLVPMYLHLDHDLATGLQANAHDLPPLLQPIAAAVFRGWTPTITPFVACLLYLCQVAPPQVRAVHPAAQPTFWDIT